MLLLQRKKKLIIPESTLGVWLDGDDFRTLSLSGTTVTQWRDKSGRGRHATPSGVIIPSAAADRPNGRNALYLDGTSAYVTMASALYDLNATTGALTLVVVAKSDGPNNAGQALWGGQVSSTVSLAMQKRNIGPGVRFRAGTASVDTTFAVGTTNRVWVLRKDGSTVRSYIDNNVLSTGVAANSTLTVLELGRFAAFPTQLWKGHICEVLAYYDTKSIAFLNSLRADYLAPKWGTVATAI